METAYVILLKLSYLTLFFTFHAPTSCTSDKITATGAISGDQTIVSEGGRFELGFFKPSDKASNYYIGIWYKQISPRTVVWVGNRVNPVPDKYSYELKLLNGNLVLINGSQSAQIIWSTNLNSTASKSVEAVLLRSGNLVVRDGSNPNRVFWQSFDHLTDTWLPGGKIGYNKKTKQKQTLSSWKTADDPAPGPFTLEPDFKERQYHLKWNNTKPYWSSGSWNQEQHIFSLVPEMRLNFLYNFSYVDNENESYFTMDVYDSSVISRSVIGTDGEYETVTWLDNSKQWNLFWSKPDQQCQVYAYCGGFGNCNDNSLPFCSCLTGFEPKSSSDWNSGDYSGGCVRKTQLSCGSSSVRKTSDRFLLYPAIALPENSLSIAATNMQVCELACLSNCSCNAYSYNNSGCSVWFGDLLNLQQLSEGDPTGKMLYLRLADSEFPSKSKHKLVVDVVVGSVGLILVVIGLFFALYRRQKARFSESNKAVEGSLIPFGYKELQTATKNFSEKLGGGGFGSVFKGALTDSSVIAVKKLESFNQGEKQFRAEVSTIGTVQHVNLVRLRGFCSDGAKKLLVYDYMPYGSLDCHLFSDNISTILDWGTRYKIALGIARGLAYLHEKCRDCIIHCDIKPENILLDADFCPKVADFGLAKLIGRDFSRVLTTMRGTRGYLAPEWISGVAITVKTDVFSYGMVLFELLSGHRNIEQSGDGTMKFFPTWAANKIAADEDIMAILDPRLNGSADAPQVEKMFKLACWCIQDNENQRPMMGQVVQTLEGVLDVSMPPIPRSLELFVENPDDIMFYTECCLGSQTRQNSSLTSSSTKSNSSVQITTSLS